MGKKLDLKSLFTRWQKGESMTTLFKEAIATGFAGKKGKFRRAIQAEAGGKEQFRTLRETGAGGKAEPFGGKRSSGPSGPRPRPSDKGLKFVKTSGWPYRFVAEHAPRPLAVKLPEGTATVMDTGGRILIVKSPKTKKEYVRAGDYEKADFLHKGIGDGMPPLRFVRWKHSEAKKRYDREFEKAEEQAERGEAALKRVKDRKRAAKLARKAKKEPTHTRKQRRNAK